MPSPFASLTVSEPIPLPFDEGQWVKVRALTGEEYAAAQASHRIGFLAGNQWSALFRASIENPTADDIVRAAADPLTGFDRVALARFGLVEWSYPQSLKRVEAKAAVPASDATPAQAAVPAVDHIADLTDDPLDFIAREVLKRSKPSLFEDAETAQVKG